MLYLLFLFVCIGGSNLVQAVEGPWLSFLGLVFTVALAVAAVLGSIWLLHAPVGERIRKRTVHLDNSAQLH